ncbi:MAG TPA: cupin domain-containing protein [Stellaceae bacterium]
MTDLNGSVFPYLDYREHYSREQPKPAVWRWTELAERIAGSHHNERGSLTLSTAAGTAGGCEIIAGMAISIQVVKPRERTRPHAHAWWHLFFVQNGTGTATFGEQQDATPLNRGDLILVPAWSAHHFENLGADDLILMSMTNLPQQAKLSNLLAREPDDDVGGAR